jgi:hypothetical protein
MKRCSQLVQRCIRSKGVFTLEAEAGKHISSNIGNGAQAISFDASRVVKQQMKIARKTSRRCISSKLIKLSRRRGQTPSADHYQPSSGYNKQRNQPSIFGYRFTVALAGDMPYPGLCRMAH